MKAKAIEQPKSGVPFDPVLFAATVPSRKPTAKDRADCAERKDDAIEPKEHASMDKIADEL